MFDAKCDALSAGVSITGVIQGNLELPLPPNSLDSHQRQRQQDKNLRLIRRLHFLYVKLIHLVDNTRNV